MTLTRVETVVNLVVGKPIAWTIYGAWHGLKAIGRGAVGLGRWAGERWDEYRARQAAKRLVG